MAAGSREEGGGEDFVILTGGAAASSEFLVKKRFAARRAGAAPCPGTGAIPNNSLFHRNGRLQSGRLGEEQLESR